MKSHLLYPEIIELLKKLPPGGKLPSVRKLMQKYGVSQITIENALRQLKEDGKLVTRVGDGTYKSLSGRDSIKIIGIAVPAVNSTWIDNIVTELSTKLEGSGVQLKIFRYRTGKAYREDVPSKGIDALIFLNSRLLSHDDLTFAGEINIPCVFLNSTFSWTKLNTVDTDNEAGGEMAAEFLISRNLKRIRILSVEPPCPAVDERIRGFLRYASCSGIKDIEIFNTAEVSGFSSNEKVEKYVALSVRQGLIGNTDAFFCVSDSSAYHLIKSLKKFCVKVPDDISVIGFDDSPESAKFIPPLTTIRQPYDQWASEALKIIFAQADGSSSIPVQKRLNPSLIIRKSVR